MTDSKVYMFPDAGNSNGNNCMSAADIMALTNGNNNANMMWNNPWIYMVWMMMFRNGFWGNNNGPDIAQTNEVSRQIATLADTVNTNHNNDLAMAAIQGNSQALSDLAGNLNVGVATLGGAINSIRSSIDAVGAATGMGAERVVNSVILGNKDIAQQICSCCCENKQLVTTMGYEGQLRDQANTTAIQSQINQLANNVQTGFASTNYATQAQTNQLSRDLQNQTQTIIDKISTMEANAQQDKINTLTAQLTAANSRAERAAELKPILDELNTIKCAQPSTTTIQYPQLTAMPTMMYNAYMNGGYGYGVPGFWN